MPRILFLTGRRALSVVLVLVLGGLPCGAGLLAEELPSEAGELSRNSLDLTSLSSLSSSATADHHGGAVSFLSGWSVAGFIDTAFTYNLDNPRSRTNELRIFDTRHSSFDLHAAQIAISREATEAMPVGAEIKLTAGQDAAGIHSAGLTDGDIDITSANIQILIPGDIPVLSGGTLHIGKFETTIGYEVIASGDNDNYSRSILFGKAIPFTHTGVLFKNEAADGKFGYNFGIVNGWDNTADNNVGKSLMLGFSVAPCEEFWFALNGIIGNEDDDDEEAYKGVIDLTSQVTIPDSGLSISFNADFGANSGDATLDPLGDTDGATGTGDDITVQSSKWYGFAAIVKLDLATFQTGTLDDCYVAIRGEVFWDPDGTQVGLASGTALAQRYKEVTVTFGWRPYENLLVRFEFRHDIADDRVFDEGGGMLSNHQNTVAVNSVFSF